MIPSNIYFNIVFFFLRYQGRPDKQASGTHIFPLIMRQGSLLLKNTYVSRIKQLFAQFVSKFSQQKQFIYICIIC